MLVVTKYEFKLMNRKTKIYDIKKCTSLTIAK